MVQYRLRVAIVLAKVGVVDGKGNFVTQPLVLVVCYKEPEYNASQNRVLESRVDLFMALCADSGCPEMRFLKKLC